MRREFTLPEGDLRFLDALGLPWETVRVGGVGRVVVHDFSLPTGYKPYVVSLNVRIETGYPTTQIDMVYFFPEVVRIDGRAIGRTAWDTFDGKRWQRWSRHRSGQNPWRPDVDDLGAHLALVQYWLERELEKR